jgi:ABC-type phosphate transport system substrate-binding protein
MPRDLAGWYAALSAALMALMMTGPSQAQSVTLRSSDGSATITGPLIRFDGNTYTIKAGDRDLSLPAAGFSCVSGACPAPKAFGIHGSNTIGAELMPRLIEAYAQSRGDRVRISNGESPDVSEIRVVGGDGWNRATIDLQARGSGTTTPGLVSGKAVVGMASRPLNETELAQLAQQGFGDMRAAGSEHVLGLDGIIVIVAPTNPVSKLSLQQLQTGSMSMRATRNPGLSTPSRRWSSIRASSSWPPARSGSNRAASCQIWSQTMRKASASLGSPICAMPRRSPWSTSAGWPSLPAHSV